MKYAVIALALLSATLPAIAEQTPEEMRREIDEEYQRLKTPQPDRLSASERAAPSSSSSSVKAYTTADLHKMVESGVFPDQGASTAESSPSDFRSCLAGLEVARAKYAGYPSRVIVSTSIARIEKFWMNKAAVLITCSALDKKMLITTSPYR